MRHSPTAVWIVVFLLGAWPHVLTAEPASESHYKGRPLSEWIVDLNDKDVAVRRHSARALREFANDRAKLKSRGIPATAARALVASMKRYEDTQYDMALTLRQLGKPAVSALIDLLSDPDPRYRGFAVVSLGRIGPDAKSAISALERAIDDEDAFVRSSARWTIGSIDPENPNGVVPWKHLRRVIR